MTGRVTPLKLPDYDPGREPGELVSRLRRLLRGDRDGKSLYAVVAQVAARKPVLAKKLAAFDAENHPDPACEQPEWQREPLRITFHPAGKDAVSFDIVPGSAVLVEDSGDDAETPAAATEHESELRSTASETGNCPSAGCALVRLSCAEFQNTQIMNSTARIAGIRPSNSGPELNRSL